MCFVCESRIWTASELRESIRKIGPMLPVLMYGGQKIDGRKRARICAELGVIIEVRELLLKEEAGPALWATHPCRALELFPVRSSREGARIFATRSARVAAVRGFSGTLEKSQWNNPNRPIRRHKESVRRCVQYLNRCEQGQEPLTIEGVRNALGEAEEG